MLNPFHHVIDVAPTILEAAGITSVMALAVVVRSENSEHMVSPEEVIRIAMARQ